MSSLAYYILDVETTGLDRSIHEITEVSIIRCSDRVQLTEMVKCDNPNSASIDALRITKKTFADLLKGNSKEFVAQRINKFLNSDGLTPAHRVIVAHNYSFDKKFIHAMYEKIDMEFPADLWMCSMAMVKSYIKQKNIKAKSNLDASCQLLGIKKVAGAAHASRNDTRNTYLLWKDLIENRNVDYLPFIKSFPHNPIPYEEPDLSLLEGLDDLPDDEH